MTPTGHRRKIDRAADDILKEKHQEALGREGTVSVERPGVILRRKLLLEQNLVVSGPASIGTDRLEAVDRWPDAAYWTDTAQAEPAASEQFDREPLRLSLIDALRIGAQNSFDYQNRKEDVFRRALTLDLARNEFRTIFDGQVRALFSADRSSGDTVAGTVQSGTLSADQRLYDGVDLSAGLAIDLANLLTDGGAFSRGLRGDASVSIPLLAGSGRHITTEPLTQAERDVVYALWDFEQFKKTYAVRVASDYLAVLRRLDEVHNSQENYRSVIASARRSRRLADAGRLQEIDVDQATQSELRARQNWIASVESYQTSLDSFKSLVGLPPDAQIELDPNELNPIIAPTEAIREYFLTQEEQRQARPALSADAPIDMEEPTQQNTGPWELDEDVAARMALDHRLDFQKLTQEVHDAQRRVIIAAEWLGAELTLGGSAAFGARRSSVAGATDDNAQLRLDRGALMGLLTLDLPLERTRERIDYRNSLINLERAVRAVQSEEDQIKLSVRNTLRTMRQARESLYIQTRAVMIAEKRVRSVNLFLEAGRAQMRDLLEAQDALLAAQNGLTTAAVNYRVAELNLQRDLGLLFVDEDGIWQEILPENLTYAQK